MNKWHGQLGLITNFYCKHVLGMSPETKEGLSLASDIWDFLYWAEDNLGLDLSLFLGITNHGDVQALIEKQKGGK